MRQQNVGMICKSVGSPSIIVLSTSTYKREIWLDLSNHWNRQQNISKADQTNFMSVRYIEN